MAVVFWFYGGWPLRLWIILLVSVIIALAAFRKSGEFWQYCEIGSVVSIMIYNLGIDVVSFNQKVFRVEGYKEQLSLSDLFGSHSLRPIYYFLTMIFPTAICIILLFLLSSPESRVLEELSALTGLYVLYSLADCVALIMIDDSHSGSSPNLPTSSKASSRLKRDATFHVQLSIFFLELPYVLSYSILIITFQVLKNRVNSGELAAFVGGASALKMIIQGTMHGLLSNLAASKVE